MFLYLKHIKDQLHGIITIRTRKLMLVMLREFIYAIYNLSNYKSVLNHIVHCCKFAIV